MSRSGRRPLRSRVDELRPRPVAGREEAVLLQHLRPAGDLEVGEALGRLEPHEALDQRGERGVVGRARLRVHDPHLERAQLGLQPHVPPQERRLGEGAAAQQHVDRLDVLRVVVERPRDADARERAEDGHARGGEAGVAPLPERRVGREREQQRHVHAHPAERPDGRLLVRHARRGRAGRTSARAGRAPASSRRSTGSARRARPRCRSTARTGACRPRRRAARGPRGPPRGRARSSASSAAAPAAVVCGPVKSSSAEPCVSAAACSATSGGSAGSTSSMREASAQSSGSRSITSSSRPSVHGVSAPAGFQRAQSGSRVTAPRCPSRRRSATS